MNLRSRTSDKIIRLADSCWLLPCAFLIGTATPTWADEGSLSKTGAAVGVSRASRAPGPGTLGREDRPPSVATGLRYSGTPTPGSHITIYANSEHVFMVIDGRRFDTVALAESGTRWSGGMTSTSGYVVRHPTGM